jgi:type IV pilus assembly protein PilV
MIDRINANPVGVDAGNYDEGTAGQTTACTSSGAGCTTAEMAGNDLYEWETSLAAQLPGGVGVVCIDETPDDGTDETNTNNGCSGTGDLYVVKVWWKDDRTGDLQRFVTTFKP